MFVFVDMDGIVADFVKAACELHNLPEPTQWDMFGDMKYSEYTKGMDVDWWVNMPKTPECDDLMDLLLRRFSNNQIFFFSSPMNYESLEGKKRWVEKHFPAFKRNLILGAKKYVAAKGNILIDDKTQNCSEFIEHGGRAWLFARPWNAFGQHRYDEIERIDSFITHVFKEIAA